jgi:hypothetical protein
VLKREKSVEAQEVMKGRARDTFASLKKTWYFIS